MQCLKYAATLLTVLGLGDSRAQSSPAGSLPELPASTAKSAGTALPPLTLVQPPELPRVVVDTTLQRLHGETIDVHRGDDLQSAIDRARRGDTIRIDPTGEWPAILLPHKPGEGWIHIQSMEMSSLPKHGGRVEARHAKHMPTIYNIPYGTPRPAMNTDKLASHYRIMGLRFKSREFVARGHNKMIMMGAGRSTILHARTVDELPHHIIIDRCLVEGWPGKTTRGLYLDGSHVAVIGCHITDITAVTESHGILITDTPGPILIENNSIGASGENIFIGNNEFLRFGVNAADITIRGNLLYKEREWKKDYGLKNHFEMKRGERVLFENNECVYSPADDQAGYSIKLKTGGYNQYVQDVTIRHNDIRDVGGYMAISNTEAKYTVKRVLSYGNQVKNISRSIGAGQSILLLLEDGAQILGDVAFVGDQLRGRPLKSLLAFVGPAPCVDRLELRDLKADHGDYGVKGAGAASGAASLQQYSTTARFRGNTLYGNASVNRPRFYPPKNIHRP